MRNFKKIARVLIVTAVTGLLLYALDFFLYPCTFIRNDIHAVITKTFDDIYLGASYGKINIEILKESKLFKDVNKNTIVWMSHTDYVEEVPKSFEISAKSLNCPVAAMEDENKKIYAVQYHPEVLHTVEGMKMLSKEVS